MEIKLSNRAKEELIKSQIKSFRIDVVSSG